VPHWTYCPVKEEDDLFQGDIIARSEPLLEVFRSVHRHFCDEKYLAFLVTTQTCDLVRRGTKACNTKHINLAVIRSLDDLVPQFFREMAGTDFEGVYLEESKYEAKQFLSRVINQNEQAQGIFYLHPDADAGIAVPAVALLRVSIALRAHEHYDTLRKERRGRISTEFRSKLGWLTGNLYSRIDTPDWSDHEGGESQAEETIIGFLGGPKLEKPNIWVKAIWIEEARKKKVDIAQLPRDQIFEKLQEFEPSPPRPTVIGRVRDLAGRTLLQLRNEHIVEIVARVRTSDAYRAMVADRVYRVALELFRDPMHAAFLFARLDGNEHFRAALASAIETAVASYQVHKGQKELTTLLGYFASTSLFTPEAIEGLRKAADAPGVASGKAFDARFAAEVPTPAMVEVVQGIARDVVLPTLIDRLIARLESDRDFTAVFKQVGGKREGII
jgi:hypothetical protein